MGIAWAKRVPMNYVEAFVLFCLVFGGVPPPLN